MALGDRRSGLNRAARRCANCGQRFNARYTGQKYCSRTCSNQHTAERRGAAIRGPRPQRRTRLTLTCPNCHHTFQRARQEAGRTEQSYCSRACFYEHLREGKAPHAEDRREDVYRYFNLKLKGEWLCRSCGKRARHLHHAVPRSLSRVARTDLRNGLPLCATCHQGWHYRTVTIYRDAFTDEEWAYLHTIPDTGRNIGDWLAKRYPEREFAARMAV